MKPLNLSEIEFELVGDFPFWQMLSFDDRTSHDDISNALEYFLIKLAARYRKHFYEYSKRIDRSVQRDYLFQTMCLIRALEHLHKDFRSSGLILREFEKFSFSDFKKEVENDFFKPARQFNI